MAKIGDLLAASHHIVRVTHTTVGGKPIEAETVVCVCDYDECVTDLTDWAWGDFHPATEDDYNRLALARVTKGAPEVLSNG